MKLSTYVLVLQYFDQDIMAVIDRWLPCDQYRQVAALCL